jgi:hypothetical protein
MDIRNFPELDPEAVRVDSGTDWIKIPEAALHTGP